MLGAVQRWPAHALFCALLTVALLGEHGNVAARTIGERTQHGIATVSVAALPPTARDTLRSVRAGGPFPYAKDGAVFGNRERALPPMPRGYYREFTVPTPGSRDRGPRRIVVGRGGESYYTDDHYRSFKRILE
jgi:ribonuclease T1